MKISNFFSSKRLGISIALTTLLTIGCNPQEDPVSPFNQMVKDYGYIGYQNSLENTDTGTLLGGRPTALAFVAHSSDCFPKDVIARHTDLSEFSKKYSYQYKGNFGFLMEGNPIVSAGMGFTKDYTVEIEITNMSMEYMSSIDVTDWYLNGMSDTCKNYLDDIGFVIQTLSTDNMKIKIKNSHGFDIGLNSDNLGQYFSFQAGVAYQIIDDYTVEITTPKYIGYQLGRLRLTDEGRSLYRAMSVVDDKFQFELLSLFDLSQTTDKKLTNGIDNFSDFTD